jgi:hypothetical protein
MRTKLWLVSALALMLTFTGTSAWSQEPVNQITYFTFSGPFELPGGKVLPAGKYVFKILDSPSNRHVVQIMSEDQRTMHATLLAIPATRLDPAPEPEVRFMEAAANAPPAVRTWWYPGRSTGHEFIYPREQARRLAARGSEGVLTVSSNATTTEQMQNADLARIDAAGQESAADRRAAENVPPPDRSRPSTKAATQPRPTTEPAVRRAETRRTTLPATASVLPLIGLLGMASLLGAGVLRFRR